MAGKGMPWTRKDLAYLRRRWRELKALPPAARWRRIASEMGRAPMTVYFKVLYEKLHVVAPRAADRELEEKQRKHRADFIAWYRSIWRS